MRVENPVGSLARSDSRVTYLLVGLEDELKDLYSETKKYSRGRDVHTFLEVSYG